MLSFSGALRVFVAIDPCDMRKGFNGLHALVTERLAEDPRGGSLFVFTNRRRNRIKILFRDRTGAWMCTKRLEGGWFLATFSRSVAREGEFPGDEVEHGGHVFHRPVPAGFALHG
jgi:transposase